MAAFAYTQIGYLGRTGPTFTADAGGGKKYIFQARSDAGGSGLYIVSPDYARAVAGISSPVIALNAADFTLGSYADNTRVDNVPTFTQPATGTAFDGFRTDVTEFVSGSSVPTNNSVPAAPAAPGTPAAPGAPSAPGATDDLTVTGKAATLSEQIQAFFKDYWYIIVILAVLLLWSPVIAPALGLSKKRKRSYR